MSQRTASRLHAVTVKRIVEGQHQKKTQQNGDVVPHQMLF